MKAPWPFNIYQTAVGKKWVMALTGLAIIGFVVAHMVGNWKIFLPDVAGVPDIDIYGHALRELFVPFLPEHVVLWSLRTGLIAAFLLHIHAAYSLTVMNHRARPVDYQGPRNYIAANYASRTMRWSGTIFGAFLIFHLADLTWGVQPMAPEVWERGAIYANFVATFSRAPVTIFYVISMVLLGMHLYHGAWSMFQSMGINHPRFNSARRYFAIGLAVFVTIGNSIMPLAVLFRVRGHMTVQLDAGIPAGPLEDKWDNHKFSMRLVTPANKRKFKIIIVGTGLAGASAAATLAELGYEVESFTFHDSPRRAHSIAAQGGINAAKNYRNDGDSVYRLFYDTIKGGDYRSREANVYRLADVSLNIIDQATAQGVPFAREYGGLLDNRSFGGAQVSRTFYARGQTGQQLLLGAYQALMRQVDLGKIKVHTRSEMLDLVVKNGQAVGIVVRDLVTGEVTSHSAHAVVLATGGYSNVFYLSTNAMASNATAIWRAHRRGAAFANPCFTQIHPTCIPASDEFQSKLTLMSESLRNDGRIWVPKNPGETRPAGQIPEEDRDYYLERIYPNFGNLVPRDVASRAAKRQVDAERGVGPLKNGVYLDFKDATDRSGQKAIEERYGNLFEMYQRITDENPYEVPMRIYPAPHYTMGGLWVDYNLMTTIPGLYAIGEANFSDHGANRLGASALMQGLADGYFVLPYTIGDYLADSLGSRPVPVDDPAFVGVEETVDQRVGRFLATGGTRSVDWFHKELGKIMLDYCGMSRDEAGLQKALSDIPALFEEYRNDLKVLGSSETLNQSLEKAGRVEDFFELAQQMCLDALHREESCGGHFREEHKTPDGEAIRDDENFANASTWEWTGDPSSPALTAEHLAFENVTPTTRSYK